MTSYYPLTSNSFIDYTVMKITGFYDRPTMRLSVTDRKIIPPAENGRQRITCLPSGLITARVYSMKWETCTAIDPKATLYTEVTAEGAGEAGGFNEGPFPGSSDDTMTIHVPPILLVPNDLTINHNPPVMKSQIYRIDQGGSILRKDPEFEYRTGVIERGAWGPRWADTIRIGYIENPPGGPVFNYVYAAGIGCVNFWYGAMNPDDTLAWGIEYYANGWVGQ